jgi:hypothetical protein
METPTDAALWSLIANRGYSIHAVALRGSTPHSTPLSKSYAGHRGSAFCRSRLRPATRIGGRSPLLQKIPAFRRIQRVTPRQECLTALPLTPALSR